MLAIILLFGCVVAAWGAPLEQAAPSEIQPAQPLREFLILTPEAQLRLQPSYKLEQSIIQPLALYGSPATRQNPSEICNQILNFPTTFPFPFPGQGGSGSGDSGSTDDSADERLEMNAERIPQGILPQTPASTVPLPERRFYTIAGRPQFFGNVELLQHPLHPIFSLQPLQAIKARSVTNPEAEIVQREKNTVEAASEALPSPQPLRVSDEASPLQAIVPGVMYRPIVGSPQARQILIAPSMQEMIARQFAQRITDPRSVKLDQEASPIAIEQPSVEAAAPDASVSAKAVLAPEAPIIQDKAAEQESKKPAPAAEAPSI